MRQLVCDIGRRVDEDPTGLLNEGFRYRDLETGVFITADPAGFVDGPNLYSYVRQNPWTQFDPKGLHVWVEKANAHEPAGHLSICTGDPVSGNYKSYSFGVVMNDRPFSLKNGLQGTVYEDTQHGGKIDSERFYYTTPEIDKALIERADKLVEKCEDRRFPYRLGNASCRDWTNQQRKKLDSELKDNDQAVKGAPPVKTAKDINGDNANGNSVAMSTTGSSQPSTADHPVSSSTTSSSSTSTGATTAVPFAEGGGAIAGVGGIAVSSTAAAGSSGTKLKEDKKQDEEKHDDK